jgi:flagellar motor switch protein FliM
MSTLAEIEAAADALTEQEKEELFLSLATRLRSATPAELPSPRKFSKEQMEAWIAEDEADMESFRRGE